MYESHTPDGMRTDERLRAVAVILARGLLRIPTKRKRSGNSREKGLPGLDLSGDPRLTVTPRF